MADTSYSEKILSVPNTCLRLYSEFIYIQILNRIRNTTLPCFTKVPTENVLR